MSSLLVEYLKRKKLNSIPLCHNGVCFFDFGDKPALIALTSLNCRPFSTCHECVKPGGVIVEMFVPGYQGSFYLVSHEHVEPDTDLLTLVSKYAKVNLIGSQKLKPLYAKSGVDLDSWLWKFITHDIPLRSFRSMETDAEMKKVEQIGWAAFKQPKTYANYYMAHEALLLNRKYLLMDNDG